MTVRIVNLILIAAVVVCPLGCGNGLCCGDRTVPLADSGGQADAEPETSCCCCHRERPADADPGQPPREQPGKVPCQGICGGAVVAKAVEFTANHDALVSPVGLLGTAVPAFVVRSRVEKRSPVSLSGGNTGRLLRALHSSLLC